MLLFELIDGDGPGFLQVRKQVFDFLIVNEHKCVSLVSHFQKNDTRIFYILDERNVIWGVFSLSSGGQILHCLESDSVLPLVQEFFSKIKPENLFSIIGEQKYTDAIAKIFINLYGMVPKSSTEYYLMEYNQTVAEQPSPNPKIDSKKRLFLAGCSIFDCQDSDFDDMFPLQKAYELEEVVIDKKAFNEKNSRILLRKAIHDKMVYGVRCNGRIIAKASINARGENCIQLGGIFTDMGFRNKGIASYLVKNLIQRFKNENKLIVLFVKKSNTTALNVYTNCGFSSFDDYKINYY